MKTYKITIFSLIFSVTQLLSYSVLAIPPAFDSLANEVNRLSLYKKTKALEMLDSLYRMAYNEKDSSLAIARCIYEETVLKQRHGIVDTHLENRINEKLSKNHLQPYENALLQSALGVNLSSQGKFAEDFSIFLKELETFKKLDNSQFIAKALNALGSTCHFLNLNSLAEYYFIESLKYSTPLHEYCITKSNVIAILSKTNKEAAIDSTLLLIEFAEKHNLTEIYLLIYLNMGLYMLNSYPEKALTYFDKIQLLDFDAPLREGLVLAGRGSYHLHNENYSESLRYFTNARKIMEENNDFYNLPLLYNSISTIFENQNQLDSALFYSRKNQEITQQLRSNTIAIETHQKYITTLLETKQKDLLISNQENELKNRLLTIITIIAGSIILLILMFLLYVNQQRKRKASENQALKERQKHKDEVEKLEKEKQQELLDAKTREITSYSLLITNKNNLLKQIDDLNIQMLDNKNNIHIKVNEIHKIIKENLNIDEEWNNFKMHFEKVHPHFFEKLKNRCETLTDENLKMCAYFKIGISTKQIAQLLNVETNTVSISRHRIKRKLNLSTDDSFSSFINSL